MNYKTIQRIETHIIREGETKFTLSSPEAIVDYMRELQNADVEKMLAIYLNNQNQVICESIIGIGTTSRCTCHPRDIIKIALLVGANSIILAHNHPSGTNYPSPEDKDFTGLVRGACQMFDIRLLDHIIIAKNAYYSFSNEGTL